MAKPIYKKPYRLVFERRVRSSMGRTNVKEHAQQMHQEPAHRHPPADFSPSREERHKHEQNGGAVHDMAHEQKNYYDYRSPQMSPNAAGSVRSRLESGGGTDERRQHAANIETLDKKTQHRQLRRQLRTLYQQLEDVKMGQGHVQQRDVSEAFEKCGLALHANKVNDICQELNAKALPVKKTKRIDKTVTNLFLELQTNLEQKQSRLMRAIKPDRKDIDIEAHYHPPDETRINKQELLNALAELQISSDSEFRGALVNMLPTVDGNKVNIDDLHVTVSRIIDPKGGNEAEGIIHKLADIYSDSSKQSNRLPEIQTDRRKDYRRFLDILWPELAVRYPGLEREKSQPNKDRSKSIEPDLFGGQAFRMPTIMERASTPHELKNHARHSADDIPIRRESMDRPDSSFALDRQTRPASTVSVASSSWSEYGRSSPLLGRPNRRHRRASQRMSEILQGDVVDGRFDEAEQFKTVMSVEELAPGQGIEGEAEKVKVYEDRYFNKMKRMQMEWDGVDGKAARERERKQQMYQNKLKNMWKAKQRIEDRVFSDREKNAGIGNAAFFHGDLDHPSTDLKSRIQLKEGPRLEAKRAAAEERVKNQAERDKEKDERELQKRATLEDRELIRRHQDEERKEEQEAKKQQWLHCKREQGEARQELDMVRKAKDGWSVGQSLRGQEPEISPGCELLPKTFPQDSLKEERRLNGIIKQRQKHNEEVAALRAKNDRLRPRLVRNLVVDPSEIEKKY